MSGWLEDLGRDVAYGLRALRRQPAFAAASIGVLALAIGGNTAVFSLVDAALLRPLPFVDPARLVELSHETPGAYSTSLPYPLLQALERNSKGLSGIAAYFQNTGISRVTLTGGGEPESVQAGFVEADVFRVLGVVPSRGRTFSEAEQLHGERVAVLGHRFWQRRFGGAAEAALGTIEIDGASFSVVGVMPQRFEFPNRAVQLWLPLTTNRSWRRDAAGQARYWWSAVGRLAAGRSIHDVETELNALAAVTPAEPRVERIRLRLLDAGVTPASRLTLLSLFGAVGAVLLIACSNLAGLLIARGQARRRELLVRLAIGAGRARLVRQLLAENLALAALAAGVGVLLGRPLLQLYLKFGPGGVPRLDQAGLDLRALLFLVGCAAATVLLFGLLPALRVTASLHAGVRGGVSDPDAGRLRTALASVQLALALVLLSSAGLLMRSFLLARSVELGFDPERTLVLRARLTPPEEPGPRRDAYYGAVLQRLASLPGVEAAGAINDLFELNAPRSLSLRAIEGRTLGADRPLPLKWTAVAGDYFRAVGATLVAGRHFGVGDAPQAPPVVIVDQAFARRFFPEGALGRRFKGNDPRGRGDEWLEIVGVVRDTRREGHERQPSAHVYEWAPQSGAATPDLLVRTFGEPRALAATVRGAVRGVDAQAIVGAPQTLEEQLGQQLLPRRFQGGLLSLFALFALALAGLGIFGVVHYAVSRRLPEIGVRVALGATRVDVVLLFLRQSARALLLGGLLGLLGAQAAGRALASVLYGIAPTDAATHAGALAALVVVVLLASLIPALQAARVDPLVALRQD